MQEDGQNPVDRTPPISRERRFRCRVCYGHGQVPTEQGVEGARAYQWRPCPYCNGTGFTTGQGPVQGPPTPPAKPPPPKIGPTVDELLQQFGTYKPPPLPSYAAERLAPGVTTPDPTPAEQSPPRRHAPVVPYPPMNSPLPLGASSRPPLRPTMRNTKEAAMRRRILLAILVLIVIVLASAAAYIYVDLRRTNDDLRATEAALMTTDALMRGRTAALNETTAILVQTRSDFAAERTVRNQLQVDKDWLRASLNTATEENTALTTDLGVALAVQSDLQLELAAAEARATTLRTEQADLETRHQTLEDQHRQLEITVGTVDEMQERANALRVELDELYERRQPLILSKQQERETGFKCTGSMEPLLTCLDTATWVYAFAPEEIIVGATIRYERAACHPDSAQKRTIAHRVMDIRVADNVYYYWPKGDNNLSADDCWVPHTAVKGYIVAIHRNTNPENAELRNKVNASWATYLAARATLAAASDAYNIVRDDYVALRVRHGCPSDVNSQCYADGAAYTALIRAFQAARRAYDAYNQARDTYNDAKFLADCWHDRAAASAYPGHIPLIPCITIQPPPRPGSP